MFPAGVDDDDDVRLRRRRAWALPLRVKRVQISRCSRLRLKEGIITEKRRLEDIRINNVDSLEIEENALKSSRE